jgi:hypothetical protein
VAGTYSNTNVAAYLSTITSGNVGAGNLTVINNFSTNVISANTFTYANGVNILNGIGGTYSNTNVEAYIGGNIGAYQIYANANAATQATSITSLATSANANTAAYLTTYTGNISANSVTLTSAIQFANLTTTQINSIGSPSRGMTVYNYTSGNVQVYNGTKWANVTLS